MGEATALQLASHFPSLLLANSRLAQQLVLKPSLGHFPIQNACLYPLSHGARSKLLDSAMEVPRHI